MITLEEALHGHSADDIPKEYLENLKALIVKVNVIRAAWDKPMTVTSGIRTMADQMRINPKAPKSNHLTGHAIDIADEGLKLTAWLKKAEGEALLEKLAIYCEEGNKNWVHLQSIPPKSNRRWFLP